MKRLFNPDETLWQAYEERFQHEMKEGMEGGLSSLPMLSSFLTTGLLSWKKRTVIVIDAGGTNLRTALIEISRQGITREYFKTVPMPGLGEEMKAADFFDALADEILPIADRSDIIGFCFSYAFKVLPNRDGRVLYLDKELNVPDLPGKRVGEGLKNALRRKGIKTDYNVTVLNDTVAAMLGTHALNYDKTWDGAIGMILGTGFNLCCPIDETIINLQAGAFTGMEFTEYDRAVQDKSADPNCNQLEKMISGAYQGVLLEEMVRLSGVFSEKTVARMDEMELTASDLTALTAGDREVLERITTDSTEQTVLLMMTDDLLMRAAWLTAGTVHATMAYCNMGITAPCMLAVEGTTFWRNDHLRGAVLTRLDALCEQDGRKYTVIHSHAANLFGAAMAAATVANGLESMDN